MVHRFRNRLMVLICKTLLLAAAVALSGCIQESSQPVGQAGKSQLTDAKTMEKTVVKGDLLAEGAALFARLCTACHGAAGNGRGSKSGPSLQRPELTYGRTSAAITESIRDGRPGAMPAFGTVFTPRQLEALTAYVLSLKK